MAPLKSTTKTSGAPRTSAVKAIRVPSGDHAAVGNSRLSSPGARRHVVSAARSYTAKPNDCVRPSARSRRCAYTRYRLSGDHSTGYSSPVALVSTRWLSDPARTARSHPWGAWNVVATVRPSGAGRSVGWRSFRSVVVTAAPRTVSSATRSVLPVRATASNRALTPVSASAAEGDPRGRARNRITRSSTAPPPANSPLRVIRTPRAVRAGSGSRRSGSTAGRLTAGSGTGEPGGSRGTGLRRSSVRIASRRASSSGETSSPKVCTDTWRYSSRAWSAPT